MNDLNEGRELMAVESTTVELLNRGEIDMQIATAHKFPRSIKKFRNEALQMVTLTEQVAESCIYALPRDGKTIEGPSARFAEVVASAWGNCRAGARVVADNGQMITAQGVFHDLERNVAITYEVQRRITGKNGNRFSPDMIAVTGNAASSIALRNAILKGVPKAFWDEMYQAARATVMGDFKTLANRRTEAIKAFVSFGVKPEQVFAKLNVAGAEDIGLDQIVILRGLLTALREGDTTPEQAFSDEEAPAKPAKPAEKPAEQQQTFPADRFEKELVGWKKLIESGKKTVAEIVATAESKFPLTPDQKARIENAEAKPEGDGVTFEQVESSLNRATDIDVLDVAADLIASVVDPEARTKLDRIYKERREEMTK